MATATTSPGRQLKLLSSICCRPSNLQKSPLSSTLVRRIISAYRSNIYSASSITNTGTGRRCPSYTPPYPLSSPTYRRAPPPAPTSNPLSNPISRRPSALWHVLASLRPPNRGLFDPPRIIVLTEYEELPPDYQDAEGLDFSTEEPGGDELRAIFGADSGLDPSRAVRLLRIMHGRRVAGTLDDPAAAPNTGEFSDAAVDAALAYLRRAVPVDEVLNAGLSAQEQLDELDREHQRREAAEGRAEPVPEKDPVYGYNHLDTMRARNEARAEARAREAAEKRRKIDEERAARGLPPVTGPLEVLRQPPPPPSPAVRRWSELAVLSGESQPPPMSHLDRLAPSAAFFLVAVGCLAAVVVVYEPPDERHRLFPSVTPAQATVGALVLVNVAVWAAWKVPPAWRFLNTYFILVHGLPRPPALLLAVFSHQTLAHLAVNTAVLWYLGVTAHDEVGGRAAFLALYAGSGMFGFLAGMAAFTVRGFLGAATLGGSGAVSGVLCAYMWLHRLDYFKVAGLPRDPFNGIPGVAFLALLVAADARYVTRLASTQVDRLAHLFGMLFGVGFLEWLRTALPERRRRRQPAHGPEGGGEPGDDDDFVTWNEVDLWTGKCRARREERKAVRRRREERELEAGRTADEENRKKDAPVPGEAAGTGVGSGNEKASTPRNPTT